VGWAFGGVAVNFFVTMYLAVVPGLVGHTGYNAVLKHISPLVVSTSLTMEPFLGSALGYVVGLADAPGWRTGLGGVVIVAAVITVIVSSKR
jgi:drug/metabolite transporter (DMT)-like permease